MSELFVRFPGTPGNYISTDDVNLLDCDSSWFAQGNGGLWTVGIPSTDQQKGDSPRSLLVAGGVSTSITPVDDGPDFSSFIYSAVGGDFDINGGTPVTVPSGTWTAITNAGSAGTYTVSAASADDYYLAEVMLGDPAFVPSLRIVSDRHYEIDVAVADYSDAVERWLIGFDDATNHGAISVNVDRITTRTRDSEGAQRLLTSLRLGVGQDNGVRGVLGIKQVAAAVGPTSYEWNDTEFYTTANGPPNGVFTSNGGYPLKVGARTPSLAGAAGDYYSVLVRDGIGGPIVAQFDPADIVLP